MVEISLSAVIRDGIHLLLFLLAGCVLSINWPRLSVFSYLFVKTLKKINSRKKRGYLGSQLKLQSVHHGGEAQAIELEAVAHTLSTVKKQRWMDV